MSIPAAMLTLNTSILRKGTNVHMELIQLSNV